MAQIVIRRVPEPFSMLRKYHLYVNGKEAGKIAHGQSETLSVKPGKHTIMAKQEWISSPAFNVEVAEGETIHLKIHSYEYRSLFNPFFMAAIIAVHVPLDYFLEFGYLIYILIPVGLHQLYYYTLGRKNFLEIREDNDA